MMIMMRKILMMAAVAGWFALFAGCNTMHGLGEDISKGGEKIQDKSER
jgi:predicted small secreted protein